MSKPYWNGSSLLLNVMSPTAGLLEGDRVEVEVSGQAKARLVLSNPTALRIHKMDTVKAAWSQSFRVECDGFLETHPEWIIPQAESRFEQRTRIDLQKGASLFFIEALAPGRVASGEAFRFRSFHNRLELRFDQQLAALEQSTLSPSRGSHSGWGFSLNAAFIYSVFVSGPRLDDDFFQFVHEQQSATLLAGSSKLASGPCWNIKLASDDPVAAKAALAAIRERFYRAVGLPLADLRK